MFSWGLRDFRPRRSLQLWKWMNGNSMGKDQSPTIAGMCSLPMARYYTIKDADQKALYSRGDRLLVGDPNVDNGCAEKICILPNRGLDRTKVPIFLGIQGGSRCLACVETGEGPTLQLESFEAVTGWTSESQREFDFMTQTSNFRYDMTPGMLGNSESETQLTH
ncbi:interleukin-1 family member 10 isoform X2 [Ailuropoda melanoleuca]|uniref:interleukin-1 family member 10 isoform X2 n=1 Tax=Ailuropoda melanoleuca TaxID=9646 RepID=UPI001494C5D8|nr:interleukin-1 family member 10 isoform X2 [Ailuropoda melanoleuca]